MMWCWSRRQPPATCRSMSNWVTGYSGGRIVPDVDPVTVGNQPGIYGVTAFSTIQTGVAGVAIAGTVHVNAGDYSENPVVNKALTMLGPKAGVAGYNSRTIVADEAVIHTNGNQAAVVTVTASNVTIDGFTISGDDTAVTGSPVHGAHDANALYAVFNANLSIDNLDVKNNIVQQTAIGFYGRRQALAGVSTGSEISRNLFRDIGVFDYGYGVTLEKNFYADVTDNVMTHITNTGLLNLITLASRRALPGPSRVTTLPPMPVASGSIRPTPQRRH